MILDVGIGYNCKLGPGWKALPHYRAAKEEATKIMSALWWSGQHRHTRVRNDDGNVPKRPSLHGLVYVNGRWQGTRFCDQWRDLDCAIAAATKVILRDRYCEVPPSILTLNGGGGASV